jgi:hypothetical protein
MQRAHSLFESIERSHRLAALVLSHVLNGAFLRKYFRQDERPLLEFAQLGDNQAAHW